MTESLIYLERLSKDLEVTIVPDTHKFGLCLRIISGNMGSGTNPAVELYGGCLRSREMFLQIGGKLESDFTQPLELLSDCHKRIFHFLNALVVAANEAGDAPLGQKQRRTLEGALRYFREGAPKHTADEEQSLFPRMRGLDSARVRQTLSKLQTLEADHKRADQRHAEAESIVREWIAEGVLPDGQRERLRTILGELSRLYDLHIALEEEEIFPLAKAILPEAEKQALGCEMAQRRGIVIKNGYVR